MSLLVLGMGESVATTQTQKCEYNSVLDLDQFILLITFSSDKIIMNHVVCSFDKVFHTYYDKRVFKVSQFHY